VASVTFSELARAAYCHRQLYYARRDDDRQRRAGVAARTDGDGADREGEGEGEARSRRPPARVRERIRLANRYGHLREATDATLADEPVDLDPAAYRRRLDRLADRDDWPAVRDPVATRVRLTGRDCHGVVHKLVATDDSDVEPGRATPRDGDRDEPDAGRPGVVDDPDSRASAPVVPSLVSPGTPPDCGVWKPHRVKAVAAALALAWERSRRIERALVEYPAVGVVRTVRLTARSRDRYRRVLRAIRRRDDEAVPPRTDNRNKCAPCEYADRCGVRSRSLRSRLGL
jgi:CRISPR-associated exonuclease Cas4